MSHSALSPRPETARTRWRITLRGAVQGIGFRPFVYRRAVALGLSGWVRNSAAGVIIEAEGRADALATLIDAIRRAPPPGARITDAAIRALEPEGATEFRIADSEAGGGPGVQVLPDLATCEECLAELLTPANRRHRYPFINCTACGPRYSIVENLPYDRRNTSMRHFALCADCRAEYEDPLNRRFHAEPNACAACGPRLALWDATGATLARDDAALMAAAQAIREGKIVAIKGIGGFHLMADARDTAVVGRLRERKRREHKPFAVLFPSMAAISACCELENGAADLLTCAARPIVLLPYRGGGPIASSVAPGIHRLGVFLPYTPLHHLLMRELGFPVVATSGNLSGEPIVTDERDALIRLAGIADLFLVHNRPIERPLDDSVAQMVCGEPQILRNGRGYAPTFVAVQGVTEGILAVGGHLKTSVALSRATDILVSQHLGDLDTPAARGAHAAAGGDLARLYTATPRLIARDLHPDYASSRLAERLGPPVVMVQHHLAHVVACLAEHDLTPPALGVAWDGTGYGGDGSLWGGEFLRVTEGDWRRIAHLRPFRLPGGDAAVREPRRAALGLLYAAWGEDAFEMALPSVATFSPLERAVLRKMLAGGINTPPTSSMGRLFDALSALVGLCQRSSYEGQAAMMLESAAHERAAHERTGRLYDIPARTAADGAPLVLDWQPALEALLADLRAGVDRGAIACAVHQSLAAAVLSVARRVGERRVILSGGCFQNVRLTEAIVSALRADGFETFWHRRVPPNDGGIALGQATWASWMEQKGEQTCAWRYRDGS